MDRGNAAGSSPAGVGKTDRVDFDEMDGIVADGQTQALLPIQSTRSIEGVVLARMKINGNRRQIELSWGIGNGQRQWVMRPLYKVRG